MNNSTESVWTILWKPIQIKNSWNWGELIQIQFKSRIIRNRSILITGQPRQSGGNVLLVIRWRIVHHTPDWRREEPSTKEMSGILTSDDGMSLDRPDRWWQGIPPRMGPKSVKFGGIRVRESPEIWSRNYGFWNYFTPCLMIFFSPIFHRGDKKENFFLYFVIFFSRKMISRHFSC